jgi:hypothetical protein
MNQAFSLSKVLTHPATQRVALGWYKTGLRPERVARLLEWAKA